SVRGGVIAVHVVATGAPDYFTRREAHRQAHIERLVELRGRGTLVGGGLSADGRTAEIFYRLKRPAELAPVVEADPYYRSGVWTAYASQSFSHVREPWEAP